MIDCIDPEVCGVSRHRSIANCRAQEASPVEEIAEAEIVSNFFISRSTPIIKKSASSRRRKR